ncbi:hypothetical protein ACFQ31_12205 [Fodinicurvata halophila]|uniref:primosomal protein N' family DNA-binding protein n=1 Tax=Fodinicurvata halophila TaxID=1419723 RepID=UPI0036379961
MVSLPASLGADEEVIEGGSVVAVLLPLPLEQPYSYHLPETLSVTRGTIVEVPLGQRRLPGVVWGRQDSAEVSAEKLKSVARVHSVPAMSRVQRRFITWVAGYTLAPPGAVLRMAVSVPAALDPPEPQRVLTRSAQAVPEDFRLTEARRRVLELAEQGFAHPPGCWPVKPGSAPRWSRAWWRPGCWTPGPAPAGCVRAARCRALRAPAVGRSGSCGRDPVPKGHRLGFFRDPAGWRHRVRQDGSLLRGGGRGPGPGATGAGTAA